MTAATRCNQHQSVQENTVWGCITFSCSCHALQELALLPENDVTAEYVDAMAAAVQEYGKADAIVLFVVQPGEKNSYDQQVAWCCSLAYAPLLYLPTLSNCVKCYLKVNYCLFAFQIRCAMKCCLILCCFFK